MNKERRTRIGAISDKIDDIASDLEMVICDEQFALDGVPENLQESPRAIAMEDAIDALQDAVSDMREVASKIREI